MISDFLVPLVADWPLAFRILAIALAVAALVMARYGLLTAIGFGIGQLVGKLAPHRRLQSIPFTREQIMREIFHSMSSVLIFTLVIGLIFLLTQAGWTRIYQQPDALGWAWFCLQIPMALLIQDFYFYWMHRLIHTPGLYERIHSTHHVSTNPSAFAAFAFHPIEAFLEIAVFIALVMVFPMNPTALIIVGLISLMFNVYGHLGYEIMPRFIAKSPLGYILNTSAYHNQHHRAFKCNYGLYTVIWDRMFGTLHPKAEQVYDRKTQRPVSSEAATQA